MVFYRLSYRFCLLAFASLLLAACVTTSSGGFNPEVSEEEALDDYIQLAVAYYEANDMVRARRHINNALAIDDFWLDPASVKVSLQVSRCMDAARGDEWIRVFVGLFEHRSFRSMVSRAAPRR